MGNKSIHKISFLVSSFITFSTLIIEINNLIASIFFLESLKETTIWYHIMALFVSLNFILQIAITFWSNKIMGNYCCESEDGSVSDKDLVNYSNFCMYSFIG